MSIDLYLAYLATCAVFFATPPGPSQLLMISNAARHGLRPALATMAGDLTANSAQMTAAAFGLAAVLATSQGALTVIKWAGVAYLLWIGLRTFCRPARPHAAPAPAPPAGLFRQGFITSAANPKAVFFFAALFPQFIRPELAVWPQLLVLGATYLVIDGVILVAYGALARRAAARLSGAWSRHLDRASGVMMMAAAALLAVKDTAVRAQR